jgi:hypothetical protein
VLKLFCIAFLALPFTLFSQTITGKAYDAESTVSGAKIINVTQNFMAYADEDGNFKIEANVNDQIAVTTLFHEPEMIVVTQKDFDDVVVIELKKKVNELDKVYLSKINEKKFETTEVENQMNIQIKNDLELRPALYSPPPNTNMDFIAIAGLIAKLFKKRNVEEPIQMAKYWEIKNLFDTDSFLNTQFLSSELKIEKEHQPLFIDFCEAKGIEKRLLLKENKFLLIEILIKYSDEFLEDNKD